MENAEKKNEKLISEEEDCENLSTSKVKMN